MAVTQGCHRVIEARGGEWGISMQPLLRSFGAAFDFANTSARHARDEGGAKADGGAGGIRTLDRALQPYNGLANRRLQPLGHSSVGADMPDAGASRKRQIQVTPRPFNGVAAP